MKKNFFYLLMLIGTVTIISSCKENGGDVELSTGTYSGDKLVLKYSDTPMLGKTAIVASIKSSEQSEAEIVLSSEVIPGVERLVLNVNTSGPKIDDFTFEGVTTIDENDLSYRGSVKDGVCTISLAFKMKQAPAVIALTEVEKWHLRVDKSATTEVVPFTIDWTVTDPEKQTALNGLLNRMLMPLVSTYLVDQGLLDGVYFYQDGNVAATYRDISAGPNVKPTMSPLNMAMYTIDGQMLNLKFNIAALISSATPTPEPPTKLASTIPVLLNLLQNGIPLYHEITTVGENKQLLIRAVLNAEDMKHVTKILELVSKIDNPVITAALAIIADYPPITSKLVISFYLSSVPPVLS